MESLLTKIVYIKEFALTALIIVSIFFLIKIGNRHLDRERKFSYSRKQVIVGILSLTVIGLVYYIFASDQGLGEIIFTIFISVIIAYVLNPMVNFLESKGIKRVLSVLLVYFGIIGLFVFISVLIFPAIFDELKNLMKILPNYSNNIIKFFDNLYNEYYKNIENLPFGLDNIQTSIEDNINKIQNIIINSIQNFTKSIMGIFSKALNLFLIPIISFYLVKDKEYFKKNIKLTIPKRYRREVFNVSRKIDEALGNFVRGQFIVALFVGIATTIGLFIIGVNYALTIGLIAGVSNFIPYFGPIIGGGLAALFALLESPIKVLWVVLLFIGIQQFEGNILSPKIMGEKVGLHPVVVIIALLIGGSLMGILGMLLAIPITTTLKILSKYIIEKISNM